jgi:hypothetical protein
VSPVIAACLFLAFSVLCIWVGERYGMLWVIALIVATVQLFPPAVRLLAG